MDKAIYFIIFVSIFTAVFTFLGYLGYKKTKTSEDYLVAGRKMNAIVVAFSYGATFISAVALIGFSGIASIYGQSILWLAFLNISIGVFIAFVFYGFRTRKMGLSLKALTMPELLGNRFNSKNLQSVSAGIIAVFMIAYTTAVFLAISRLVEVTFNIPYAISVIVFTIIVAIYLVIGGLYAVMWSDTIQGVLMLIGMVILTVGMYTMLGGIGPAHEAAAALTAEQLAAIGSPAATQAPNGLTSFAPFMSQPFMIVLTLVLGVGIGVLAQPQLVLRYLSAKDERALRLAVPYGGIFILLMTFTAFSIGPLCNVFMVEHGLMYPGTPDKVIPLIINNFFPTWFVYLFLFAVLAAAMSTASSLLHVAGACVGRDIYGKMKGVSEKKSLTVTRIATLGIVGATLIISLRPPDVVAFMCAFFFGLMGSTFLAAYTFTLYWKKTSKAGAWAGILGGFSFTMLWYVFVYYKTAPAIIGSSIIGSYKINMLDPLFIALPLSFILVFVVSILVKQSPKEEKIVEKAFEDIH